MTIFLEHSQRVSCRTLDPAAVVNWRAAITQSARTIPSSTRPAEPFAMTLHPNAERDGKTGLGFG
jgi:hypothetical protein